MKCESGRSIDETNIEFNNIPSNYSDSQTEASTARTPHATNPYLRTISLPSYENVMAKDGLKTIETPPPKYDETKFPLKYPYSQ